MEDAEYRQQMTELDDELASVYRRRRRLMEQFAEATGVAVLPAPRRQTDVQRRVARCPRCGGRLDD